MKNDLIKSIGRQLNIPEASNAERLGQIIYSVAGRMALASLWDYSEDRDAVSIQHFKHRTSQILDAYISIYPQLKYVFPDERDALVEEIYSIYLRTGHFYHSAYKIYPAAASTSGYQKLFLHRGISPDAKLFMSGLGFYSVQQRENNNSISSMFGLQTQPMNDYLQELLSNGEWEPVEWSENTEFLRLEPPFSRGYWQQVPYKNKAVALARYGEPNKIYVFYRFQDGVFQQKPIPEWRVKDFRANDSSGYGEYRRIAAALLTFYGTLPEIRVHSMGEMVEVKLGYRLPPSEEDFFKLYSWPSSFDISVSSPQVFIRKMAKPVYPMFRNQLEQSGYSFLEE